MPEESATEVTIPKGLGPGDVPGFLPWPRSLWIVLPGRPTSSQRESFARLREMIKELDLQVSEVKVQDTSGVEGRVFPLLAAKDVAGLYRRAHRARTAVIALCGAKVLLDISEMPSNKGCISLERFVRYKCFYSLITRMEEVDAALTQALDWMGGVHCEDSRDPRCLPTAIFETKNEYSLDTQDQRQSFVAAHRASKRSNALTDACSKTWEAGPNHTLDLLQVGGRTLPIGFHWDVQTARDTVVVTGWERWRVPGKGYTNVHPDAYVRGGNATRTHPSPAEVEGRRSPKTPRAVRRSKGRK